jgi:hypothetical protein
MQFSPAFCHFLPLRSKHFPQHPVLKHPQSIFFSWDKKDKVSHPYKTGKITVQYIFVFTFLNMRREDKSF